MEASFRNCAKSHKNRNISTHQQHSRKNLKSGNIIMLTELSNSFIGVVLPTRFQLYSHNVSVWVTVLLLTC